ncbi:MAG: tetratricopeptide repeat protein [Candidatus Hermodarchaeota archaeon]
MTAREQGLIKAREQLSTNPQEALHTFANLDLWPDKKFHPLSSLYSIIAQLQLENTQEAQRSVDEALKRLNKISLSKKEDKNLIKLYSIVLNRIGVIFFKRENYPIATRLLRAALKFARKLRLDEKHLLSYISLNLAQCYLQTGQDSEALQVLNISKEIAENKIIQSISNYLAYFLLKEKDWKQAAACLEEAVTYWRENREIDQKVIELALNQKVQLHQRYFERFLEQDLNQAQTHLQEAVTTLKALNKENEELKLYYEAAEKLRKIKSTAANDYYLLIYERLDPVTSHDPVMKEILEMSLIRLAFQAIDEKEFLAAKVYFQKALMITVKNKERILSMLSHIREIESESTDLPSDKPRPPLRKRSQTSTHSETPADLPSINESVSYDQIKNEIGSYYKTRDFEVSYNVRIDTVRVDLIAQKRRKRIILLIAPNLAEAAISTMLLKGIPSKRGLKKVIYLIKGNSQEIETNADISVINQLKALPI